jgi:hypothetical protein
MFTSPLSVINQTLDQLQALRELLSDEFDPCVINHAALSDEQRLCKETVQTISVLVPKLEAVRRTSVVGANDYSRACLACDD